MLVLSRLVLAGLVGALCCSVAHAQDMQEVLTALNQGQASRAVILLQQARKAGDHSAFVYNNLGAAYLQRGQYHRQKVGDLKAALKDYRMAVFYTDLAWPDGLDGRLEGNRKLASGNLAAMHQALGMRTPEQHLKAAKDLRMIPLMEEAAVEFAQVLAKDPNNTEAKQALGDVFNVLAMPEKSLKFYADQSTPEARLRLAAMQYRAGKVEESAKTLNTLLADHPNHPMALNQLRTLWETEARQNPGSVIAHANLGAALQKQKQYQSAIQAYLRAEQLAAQDPTVSMDVRKSLRLNIGTLYQENGELKQAADIYQSVLQVDPANREANFYMARLYRKGGRLKDAERLYYRYLALQPADEQAHTDLVRLITVNPQTAPQALTRYANTFTSNPQAQATVAEAFHRAKQYPQAAQYYERAVQLKPDYDAAWANLSAVYATQGQEQQAQQAIQRALALKPDQKTYQQAAAALRASAGAQFYAAALQKQEAGQDALPDFRQAVQAEPANPDYHLAYGVALQQSSRLNEAVSAYQQALRLRPDDAQTHYSLGTAYHQLGRLTDAQGAYEQALRYQSDLKEAQEALVSLQQASVTQKLSEAIDAYNARQYPKALTLLDQAAKADPQNPTLHYYRGLTRVAQGQKALAVTSYQEAVRLNPEYADAYYALALVLDETGNKSAAKNAFQQFVNLSPEETEYARYAKIRLSQL